MDLSTHIFQSHHGGRCQGSFHCVGHRSVHSGELHGEGEDGGSQTWNGCEMLSGGVRGLYELPLFQSKGAEEHTNGLLLGRSPMRGEHEKGAVKFLAQGPKTA